MVAISVVDFEPGLDKFSKDRSASGYPSCIRMEALSAKRQEQIIEDAVQLLAGLAGWLAGCCRKPYAG